MVSPRTTASKRCVDLFISLCSSVDLAMVSTGLLIRFPVGYRPTFRRASGVRAAVLIVFPVLLGPSVTESAGLANE
jgi:hypothetical protein